MRGTETDRPPSAEEHAYFQQIEEAFLRLRGKAVLLSSSDWQVAQGWHRAGVPGEIVVQVMEQLFERARERKGRRISSLKYFQAAVHAAWEEVATLSAGSRKERLEPLRVEERLARLAAALPEEIASRQRWSDRLLALGGALDEVEAQLSALDRELLQQLERELSAADRAEIDCQIESALKGLRSRLPAEELARSRDHLELQLLRRFWRIPLLSLFSPAAREAPPQER